jgi:hypothetical protein
MTIHKKVIFQDREYWYHETPYGANVSPLSHYDDSGKLLADPHAESFAIVTSSGIIMRYGNMIGRIDDLKEV